jgi:large subunit ribosomal protein L18
MATGATYSVGFRRKRKQKTDYKRRLNLLKSEVTRFVVRPSNKHIIAQLIDYSPDGDKVLVHVNSSQLAKLGWSYGSSSTPAAYLTGLLCGVKGKGKGIDKAILDTGLYKVVKGSKIFGCLKGLQDAGVESNADESVMPSQDRMGGKSIASYSEKSKNMETDFKKVKEAILKSGK